MAKKSIGEQIAELYGIEPVPKNKRLGPTREIQDDDLKPGRVVSVVWPSIKPRSSPPKPTPNPAFQHMGSSFFEALDEESAAALIESMWEECEALYGKSTLTEEKALRAYAKMMNTLSVAPLEPLLADDLHYSSQWVLGEIASKAEYLAYIRPKLETIRQSGMQVFAEMATVNGRPCLVMAQGSKNDLQATVLAEVSADKIVSLAMCMVPDPATAVRTGEYPR